ncbi:Uncharacterized conserved protein (DUF2088) [Desulfosporosinus orientis DSM 765]|uniref:Uncharacterized conserved protein (DUF2088) n=1 Tax=Desulfosporosinus orientis (strain ATCC 19365 / DSM 765 / NCIMB 8382 / VKM B-1628 / Singapore I) TaxID=768706 RepID=G7WIY8_DESOD|nr:lactate racemase domain-containing protein [Desulfosporosinus orientis]AET69713.1 Uncharacterized conserved protein (DUF2088) [Desulfosporosinus orientis DSM 765]
MDLNLFKVKQEFNSTRIDDISLTISQEFEKADLADRLKPGSKIAVAVGSRGIANISDIVKSVIKELKKLNVCPFIVPAMGSHGGATAAGQLKVLNSLGVTEKKVGVPLHSSMEVVRLGEIDGAVPLYFDKLAAEADSVFVINRVKPHTDFGGPLGSGLIKMISIGLGKHKGCVALHTHGLSKYIPVAAKLLLEKVNILGGLAIVENSQEETAHLELVKSGEMFEKEEKLLEMAKSQMARLPFKDLDVLIVKSMGKAISGTGMDTNVIGRLKVEGLPEQGELQIKRIVALDLAGNSYGNALGIGLADLTTKKLVDKIDFKPMYANVISTSYLERGKIPIFLDTDKEAVETALKTIGPRGVEKARICIIKNTLELEEFYVSASLVEELRENRNITIVEEIGQIPFAEDSQDLLLF